MSEPPVDTSAEAVENMLVALYGHPAQAMLRAMKRERGELRQRVLEAEKAARVTLEQAERAGPCFKSILLREALAHAQAELAKVREDAGQELRDARRGKARSDFAMTWALVRAAGGKVVVEPHHLRDLPNGRLHQHEEPTGAIVFRATVEGEPPA